MAAPGTGSPRPARSCSYSCTGSCAARIGCACNRDSDSCTAGSRRTGRRTRCGAEASGNRATG